MNRSSLITGLACLAVGMVVGAAVVHTSDRADLLGVPTWLEMVHRICTSVGGLGTVAALIFVVRQFNLLRQQTDLVQKNIASTFAAELYRRLDSFNRFIVDHHDAYELLEVPYNQTERAEMRSQLHHLCDLGFTFYEEIFKQRQRYGLLTAEDWNEWQHHMRHFFRKPYVAGYWNEVAHRYAQSFQDFTRSMLENGSSNTPVSPRA